MDRLVALLYPNASEDDIINMTAEKVAKRAMEYILYLSEKLDDTENKLELPKLLAQHSKRHKIFIDTDTSTATYNESYDEPDDIDELMAQAMKTNKFVTRPNLNALRN